MDNRNRLEIKSEECGGSLLTGLGKLTHTNGHFQFSGVNRLYWWRDVPETIAECVTAGSPAQCSVWAIDYNKFVDWADEQREITGEGQSEHAIANVFEDGSITLITDGDGMQTYIDEAAARAAIDEYILSDEVIEQGAQTPKEQEEEFWWHEVSLSMREALDNALIAERRAQQWEA